MRCPSCNKFAAMNFEDPEETNFESDEVKLNDEDGTVSGPVSAEVRIYRTSECCGDEMKEANLEMSEDVDLDQKTMEPHIIKIGKKWAWKQGCGLNIEHDDPSQVEEGGGRYAKSYFGASVSYHVYCTCDTKKDKVLHSGELTDKVPASGMDELS